MKQFATYITLFALSTFMISACGSSQKVQRISQDKVTDMSGRWNDTDARLVAEQMVNELKNSGWLQVYREDNGENPVLIVGNIRNETMEHIDTDLFIKDLERELINSGKITFVASPEEREAIRQEREEQQEYASFDSAKRLAQELGADYMLIGNISSVVDKSGGQAAVAYSVNLELINVENNVKAWIGNKKIKKLVSRDAYKM